MESTCQSNHKTPAGVPRLVLVLTGIFTLLGLLAPAFLSSWEPYLVLGLMLVLGLPHGATDHGLFLAMEDEVSALKGRHFFGLYFAIIGLYALIWLLVPWLAFGIFMVMAIYHFGQSNWINLRHQNFWVEKSHYLLWGAGVLLTPILLHSEEAAAIVGGMTKGTMEGLSETTSLSLIGLLGAMNVVMIIAVWLRGEMNAPRAGQELLSYGLLMAMFFTNGLLLGFTIYFVFWHSLSSAKDQLYYFQKKLSYDHRRQLFWEIAVVVLGALMFCLIVWFGPGPEAALQPGIIGGVFMFISLLTLPHMLLVEQLYGVWLPTAKPAKGTARRRSTKQLFGSAQTTNTGR
ncbi:Brp/Blh family beta-carotene 15,15'-dioxygenase [Lewinella sp. W8]|uniref:Brp/Blh family beta-carotene 15,15'-dioxygenase n=1 Tax=Lewinella sp. W8 TaxID=2528208 RepID=UPI0010687630|nr:Brp/Blh family beta-carotene 15,15'-dioxygenase [Lewinella sp. W8]MTB49558.1 beta-carotene 15,15'-dioxygenase, Brp/Blh family [Lewinella sp. W8]